MTHIFSTNMLRDKSYKLGFLIGFYSAVQPNNKQLLECDQNNANLSFMRELIEKVKIFG